MQDTKIQLCQARENLRAQTRGIIMQYEQRTSKTEVSNNFKSVGSNVEVILCSLDSNEMTVINVKFNKGGELPVHSHDRVEHIYILDGTLTDLVTNTTYKKGEVFIIPPNKNHHLISDFALLVVTWTPAYEGEVQCKG